MSRSAIHTPKRRGAAPSGNTAVSLSPASLTAVDSQTGVIGTCVASGGVPNSYTYALAGVDAASFSINSATGVVSVPVALAAGTYSLIVRVTNAFGLSTFSRSVTVSAASGTAITSISILGKSFIHDDAVAAEAVTRADERTDVLSVNSNAALPVTWSLVYNDGSAFQLSGTGVTAQIQRAASGTLPYDGSGENTDSRAICKVRAENAAGSFEDWVAFSIRPAIARYPAKPTKTATVTWTGGGDPLTGEADGVAGGWTVTVNDAALSSLVGSYTFLLTFGTAANALSSAVDFTIEFATKGIFNLTSVYSDQGDPSDVFNGFYSHDKHRNCAIIAPQNDDGSPGVTLTTSTRIPGGVFNASLVRSQLNAGGYAAQNTFQVRNFRIAPSRETELAMTSGVAFRVTDTTNAIVEWGNAYSQRGPRHLEQVIVQPTGFGGALPTGGLAQGTRYFWREITNAAVSRTGSFYDTLAHATAGGSTGRIPLTDAGTPGQMWLYPMMSVTFSTATNCITLTDTSGTITSLPRYTAVQFTGMPGATTPASVPLVFDDTNIVGNAYGYYTVPTGNPNEYKLYPTLYAAKTNTRQLTFASNSTGTIFCWPCMIYGQNLVNESDDTANTVYDNLEIGYSGSNGLNSFAYYDADRWATTSRKMLDIKIFGCAGGEPGTKHNMYSHYTGRNIMVNCVSYSSFGHAWKNVDNRTEQIDCAALGGLDGAAGSGESNALHDINYVDTSQIRCLQFITAKGTGANRSGEYLNPRPECEMMRSSRVPPVWGRPTAVEVSSLNQLCFAPVWNEAGVRTLAKTGFGWINTVTDSTHIRTYCGRPYDVFGGNSLLIGTANGWRVRVRLDSGAIHECLATLTQAYDGNLSPTVASDSGTVIYFDFTLAVALPSTASVNRLVACKRAADNWDAPRPYAKFSVPAQYWNLVTVVDGGGNRDWDYTQHYTATYGIVTNKYDGCWAIGGEAVNSGVAMYPHKRFRNIVWGYVGGFGDNTLTNMPPLKSPNAAWADPANAGAFVAGAAGTFFGGTHGSGYGGVGGCIIPSGPPALLRNQAFYQAAGDLQRYNLSENGVPGYPEIIDTNFYSARLEYQTPAGTFTKATDGSTTSPSGSGQDQISVTFYAASMGATTIQVKTTSGTLANGMLLHHQVDGPRLASYQVNQITNVAGDIITLSRPLHFDVLEDQFGSAHVAAGSKPAWWTASEPKNWAPVAADF